MSKKIKLMPTQVKKPDGTWFGGDAFGFGDGASVTDEHIREVAETENTKAEISHLKESIVQSDCFGINRQRVCVFYDTFVRANTEGFGDITESEFVWDESYRDLVKIESNKLVCKSGNDRKPVFIAGEYYNDFCVESTINSTDVNSIALVIFGKDSLNQIFITVENKGESYNYLGININKRLKGVTESILQSSCAVDKSKEFHTITAHYMNGTLYVYVNKKLHYKSIIDVNGLGNKVGVLCSKAVERKYASFSVFRFRDFVYYSTSDGVDYGYPNQGTSLIPTNGNRIIEESDISPYAERHYLSKNLVTSNANARCETVFNDILYQTPLKKVTVEFDKYFKDFIPDSLEEIIFQFHGRNNANYDGIASGFSPCIAIGINGEKLYLSVVGSDDRSISASPTADIVTLCDVKPDEWMHFKLEITEGCSKHHSPMIVVYIDGKYVGFSDKVNQYCEDLSCYFQYGVYKWSWVSREGNVTERNYLTDNVVVRY